MRRFTEIDQIELPWWLPKDRRVVCLAEAQVSDYQPPLQRVPTGLTPAQRRGDLPLSAERLSYGASSSVGSRSTSPGRVAVAIVEISGSPARVPRLPDRKARLRCRDLRPTPIMPRSATSIHPRSSGPLE